MAVALLGALMGGDESLAATGYTQVGAFGEPGSDPGQFAAPKRIAVDAQTGNLFAVDAGNNRVQVYASSGPSTALLTQIGGLSDPFGVAVDDSASPATVYVSDAGNNRIVKLVSDGAPVPSFSVDGTFASPALGSATGDVGDFHAALAVDPTSGDLLVADPATGAVKRFNASGAFVSSFDGAGSAGGAFTGLLDIATAPTGEIYVVDAAGGGRGERYSPAGAFEATIVPPGTLNLTLVTVDAHNANVIFGYSVPAGGFFSLRHLAVYQGTEQVVDIPLPGTTFSDPAAGVLTGLAADDGATGHLYAFTDNDFSFIPFGQVGGLVYDPGVLGDVSIDAPTNVHEFSADLSGSVNPNGGADTTAHFEVSTDGSSWSPVGVVHDDTTDLGLDGGSSPVAISDTASGLSQSSAYFVRLVVQSPGGSVISDQESFTTLAVPPPTVEVDNVVSPGGNSASLTGRVNPNGFETAAHFELSDDFGLSWTPLPAHDSSTEPGLASSTSAVELADEASDLRTNTVYQVRLVASNAGGQTISGAKAFITAVVAPVVLTKAAGGVTDTTARLGGTIDPKHSPTTYWVEYGTDTSYGNSVPEGRDAYAGAADEPSDFSQKVTGLQPGTIYHYRLVAQNGDGGTINVTQGQDRTFKTLTGSDEPTVGRAFEMVSPSDKNGINVEPDGRVRASTDGDRVAYLSFGSFAGGGGSGGVRSQYLAARGAGGWDTLNINPPYDPDRPTIVQLQGQFEFTDDLARGTAIIGQSDKERGGPHFNTFLYDNSTHTFTPISRPWQPIPETIDTNLQNLFAGASADFGRIAIESPATLTPDADAPEGSAAFLYEWTGSELRLASVLPDGHAAPGGASLGGGIRVSPAQVYPGDHAISRDGARIYFTTHPFASDSGKTLYLRQDLDLDGPDAPRSVQVDASERTSADANGDKNSYFQLASADGRFAFFTTAEKLTDDATAGGTGDAPSGACTPGDGCDLYRFDADADAGERLTDLTTVDPDGGGVGGATGNQEGGGVVGASEDGSRVFFVATGDLAPGATDEELNLYLWQDGLGTRYIATLDPGDVSAWSMILGKRQNGATWTADGGRLLIRSRARLTAHDNDGHYQLYLYNVANDELVCVSCNPRASSSTGDAWIKREGAAEGGLPPWPLRNLVADGQRVFFDSAEPLDPADTNNRVDVYEWANGHAQLVSTGTSDADSAFIDASADGKNVFIATRQRLVGWDTDDLVDLYDARVDGGFPEPVPTPHCNGDPCQGSPPQDPDFVGPERPDPSQPGNDPGPRPTFKLAQLSKAQRAGLAQGHRITLKVRVNREGKVRAQARAKLGGKQQTVARATKRAAHAGTVALPIRLSREARSHLAKRTPLRVKLTVAFTGTLDKVLAFTVKPPRRR